MELFLVGLVALVVGVFLGSKLVGLLASPVVKDLQKTQAIDRASYLFTLRRELANILIWRDPQRYVKLYKELCTEFNSFKSWGVEEINKRLSELSKEYPFYTDFDTVGSKEYVLYPDAVSWNSYEKLESNYRDIANFVALSILSNTSWQDARHQIRFNFTDEYVPDKLEHLLEYVERIEDTKLIMKIERAMDAYYSMCDKETGVLDNDFFAVKILYRSSPDLCYSLHIKRTNEFAIYTIFHFDEGGTSKSYYRCDSTFEKEELLFSNPALLDELNRPL